jgi:uncharacterized membrane protein YkoI
MCARRFIELSILLFLLGIPMSALARQTSDTQMPALTEKFMASERAAISTEIKVFSNVQISVRDAIAIAEKRTPGGKVVDVSFDGRADRPAYRVKAHWHNEIWDGVIDASTGMIVGDGKLISVSTLDVKDRNELARFRAAGIDLSDATEIAERYESGKAVSAGLEEENGKLIFLVVVVSDGSLKEISLDPNEGRRPPSNIRKK